MGMVFVMCAVCFVLGVLSLILMIGVAGASGCARHRKASQQPAAAKKAPLLERLGTMNLILVLIGAALLIFTVAMVGLFKSYGSIPDTLVSCVFAVLGGECGVMGWIKTTKEKARDQQWAREDEANRKDG